MANKTGVSEHGAHIGITTYGHNSSLDNSAYLVIKLSDHTEYKTFAAAVDGLLANRKEDFGTKLLDGLEKTLDEMFNVANGARPNTQTALILITDGECTGCDKDAAKTTLSNLASRIKDEKIKMLMIGVGKTYDQITKFDVSAFVGREDFSELKNYDDLLGPKLLEQMAVVCDGM